MSGSIDGTPGASGYLVSDLIGMALEQLGVGVGGQNSDPQGLASGVMHLNMMLAQWQRRRWLVPNLVDSAVASNGMSIYRVGPGGDIDIPVRPAQIEAAYARLVDSPSFLPATGGDFASVDFNGTDFFEGGNGVDPELTVAAQFDSDFRDDQFSTQASYGAAPLPIDYALSPISSYEDYAGLGLKGLRTWPQYYFYNQAFPLGELRPWPIPQAGQWELHIVYKAPLPSNLTAESAINLPPEYWDAIMWALAARLAPSYGQQPNPVIVSQAKAALATLRAANTQVPTLGMPSILTPMNNPFWWPGLQIQRL